VAGTEAADKNATAIIPSERVQFIGVSPENVILVF
jgi:hypothetical protein